MKKILTRLFNHEILSRQEAEKIMSDMTRGVYNEVQTAALLTVYKMRSPSVEELIGFRNSLLESRIRIDLSDYNAIDIVGTGGDGKNTFNISTCACFVVAGAGYRVAKHGNYGATSVSGASNVMEQHGVKFTNDESRLRRSIEGCGMAYLHAPLFNPAMKAVAPVRKALQVSTLFNLLGPLVNPSLPANQLLGVANLELLRLYAQTFQTLGLEFAVVTSLDGYDEISLTDSFKVIMKHYERIYRPDELGLPQIRQEELFGGDTPEEAARIFDNVLTGKATVSQTNCVLINAAFAIQILEPSKSIGECLETARASLAGGKAAETQKKFIALNS